jgi:hypothetical protein
MDGIGVQKTVARGLDSRRHTALGRDWVSGYTALEIMFL